MARKKSSGFDDVVALVALMPWWAGLAAALLVYGVLHQLATLPAPAPAHVGAAIQRTVVTGFANVLQYFAPVAFVLGAGVSYIKRRQRGNLFRAAAAGADASVLNGITWRDFELLVGEAFRLRGYTVVEMGGKVADGGVDLVLNKAGRTYLVQCKQWKTALVDVRVVRELYGVMAARRADGGCVVTSGRFTSDAKAFAEGNRLRLVDGPQLFAMIRQAQEVRGGVAALFDDGPEVRTAAKEAPECPKCGAVMVHRVAQNGADAETWFWGCSRFPRCQGTR